MRVQIPQRVLMGLCTTGRRILLKLRCTDQPALCLAAGWQAGLHFLLRARGQREAHVVHPPPREAPECPGRGDRHPGELMPVRARTIGYGRVFRVNRGVWRRIRALKKFGLCMDCERALITGHDCVFAADLERP